MTSWQRGPAPGSHGAIFAAVRSGETTSRPAISRATGLAPSTVSLRIDALVRLGLLEEHGDDRSQGGRPARRLHVAENAGCVAAVEIGAHHVTVALADLGGTVTDSRDLASAPQDPVRMTADIWALLGRMLGGSSSDRLLGIAIGAPAPIEHPSGLIAHPSFMPDWDRVDLPALFAAHTEVPVVVENDANLVALAENAATLPPTDRHLLAVKLGSRIGCGIISGGRLHRGARGAAGEISHVPVDGEQTIPCVCSTPNCLESVASGGAVVARLSAAGMALAGPSDAVDLGRQGDPAVIAALRDAGTAIGGALAAHVNFFNPDEIVLSGIMAASAPLVASIRAEVFRRALPVMAENLEVRVSRFPQDAETRGAVQLILDEVLAPARIDELVRSLAKRDRLEAEAPAVR